MAFLKTLLLTIIIAYLSACCAEDIETKDQAKDAALELLLAEQTENDALKKLLNNLKTSSKTITTSNTVQTTSNTVPTTSNTVPTLSNTARTLSNTVPTTKTTSKTTKPTLSDIITTTVTTTVTGNKKNNGKEDVWKECLKYKQLGYCEQELYKELLHETCYKTCYQCQDDCSDLYKLNEICQIWKLEGQCSDETIGTVYCKHTCGRCCEENKTKRGVDPFNQQKNPNGIRFNSNGVPIGIWGK